jgi:hypothetical protein
MRVELIVFCAIVLANASAERYYTRYRVAEPEDSFGVVLSGYHAQADRANVYVEECRKVARLIHSFHPGMHVALITNAEIPRSLRHK